MLSDVIENEIVKKTKFSTISAKVNILENKISDATTLVHINQYNTDKQNLKLEMLTTIYQIPLA